MKSVFALSAALLSVSCLAVGCGKKPAPKSTPPVIATTAPQTQPAESETSAQSPVAVEKTPEQRDLLAEQMAAYAAKLEEALAKRDAADKAQAEAAAAATQPSPETPVIEPPAEISVAPRSAEGDEKSPSSDNATVAGSTGRPSAAMTTDALLQSLARRTKEYPRDVAVHLDYQLLQFIREEKVPAMPDIAALPVEDRELLAAVLDSLSNFRSAVRRDNNMLQSEKVKPLMELATRLRAQSELTIPTLALCSRVKAFGVYEPMEAEFAAGRDQQVIIYAEVENFVSQFNAASQQWETRLKQDVVLYTEGGLPVWQAPANVIVDLSRNRRRDFFVVEKVTLPNNLTIGRYLMKVSVVDQHANRIAEATLPVKVVARAGGAQPQTAPAPTTAPASTNPAAVIEGLLRGPLLDQGLTK